MSKVIHRVSDGRIQLSRSFHLSEFMHAGANPPAPCITQNLVRLARLMELVQVAVSKPCVILSGYLPLKSCIELGLPETSEHLWGGACRFMVAGRKPSASLRLIDKAGVKHGGLLHSGDDVITITLES